MEQDFGWERYSEDEEECETCDGDYVEEESGIEEMLETTFGGSGGGDDKSNGCKKRSRETPKEKDYIKLDDAEEDEDDDEDDDMDYYRQELKKNGKARRTKQRQRNAAQQMRKPANRTFAAGNEYFVRSVLRWEAKTLRKGEDVGSSSGKGCGSSKTSMQQHLLPLEEAPVRYANMDEFFHAQIEVAFAEAKAIIRQGLKKDSTKRETCNVKAREKYPADSNSVCLKLEIIGRRHNGVTTSSSSKEDDWRKSGSVVLLQPKKKDSRENEGALGIVVDVSNIKGEDISSARNKYVHVQTNIKTENVEDQVIVTPLGNVLTQKRIVAVAVSRPKISFEAQVLGTKNATYTRFSDSDDDCDGDIKSSTTLVERSQRKSAAAKEEVNDGLNESQRFALERFMNDRGPGSRLKMVQGPPGTGKTHFCAKLLHELTFETRNQRQRLLVCAPTNKAVIVCLETFLRNIPRTEDRDKIGKSIALYGVEDALESAAKDVNIIDEYYVYRRLDSLCAKLKNLSSDGTARKNGGKRSKADVMADLKNTREEMKRIAKFLLEMGSYVSELLLNPCDRKNVSQNMEVESTVKDFIERIEGKTKADNLRNRDVLAKAVLSNARLCFCTLGSCGGLYHSGAADCDVLIVDEAANCLEGEILLAFARNPKRCLLIGDPQQLPAMCFSRDVQRLGYNKSLMERLFACYGGDQNEAMCTMLKTQYRMHPEICAWPSERFYGGKLQNAECVENSNNTMPYSIVNVHSGKHRVSSSSSISNDREAEIAVDLVLKLRKKALKIGIITFYTAQVRLIANLMRAKNVVPAGSDDDVFASTVDSFQGSEADVIILSCVRTSKTSAGFLSDSRRLNVSLTRAKKKLIVLCNADALAGGGETLEMLDLKSLIENAKTRNVLFSESEPKILDMVAAL